jgi:hypothetical protein
VTGDSTEIILSFYLNLIKDFREFGRLASSIVVADGFYFGFGINLRVERG